MVRTYAYWENTQRLHTISVDSEIVETYTWTANGELATKTTHATGEVQTNVWGLDGTLIGTGFEGGANDGVEVVYEYDHEQTLIARKVYRDGNLEDHERYLVDNNNLTGYSQILAIIGGDGKIRRFHDFADELRSQTTLDPANPAAPARHDLLLTDALGSVRGLTTTRGAALESTTSYNYAAFGSVLEGSGDRSLTSYAFTGQYADPFSQLQYHRARWLDTGLGQWASQDAVFDFPAGFGAQYGYVGQSPLVFFDSSGDETTLMGQVGTMAAQGWLMYDQYCNYRDLIMLTHTVVSGGAVSVIEIAFVMANFIPGVPSGLSFKALTSWKQAKHWVDPKEVKEIGNAVRKYGNAVNQSKMIAAHGKGAIGEAVMDARAKYARGLVPDSRHVRPKVGGAGADGVYKYGDEMVLGEAKMGVNAIASPKYSTRIGQNLTEKQKVLYGSGPFEQGSPGCVMDYINELGKSNSGFAKDLKDKWKQGKLHWYEVRVKGNGASGAGFNPEEIYEEFRLIPFMGE